MKLERRFAAILSGLSYSTTTSNSSIASENEPGVAVLDAVEILLPARHTSKQGSILVRRATVEDMPGLRLVTHYGFASNSAKPTGAEVPKEMADKQHWGAFEDGRAVSQLYAHDWTLGGGVSGCRLAAVSGVGTLPEFRRLGLLRTMMRLLFEDMMQEGQHVAALYATQAAIYQRYGYSEGVRNNRSYAVDTVDVKFLDGDAGSCAVGRETLDVNLEPTLRNLYESYIDGRACCLAWDSPNNGRRVPSRLRSEDDYSSSSPPVYCAVARDEGGNAKGYCLYTTQSGWGDNAVKHPTRPQRLKVQEFIWIDMDAYRSIWSFLASMHDLVGEISVHSVPADDPAASIFLEPRLLQTTVEEEGSWWRIVDVKGTLEHRIYNTIAGSTLTLAVSDDDRLAPWNTGTWTLTVDPASGKATAVKTPKVTADVVEVSIGIAELASLWTGAVTALQLSQWGLLTSSGEAALLKANTMFAPLKAPFCMDGW